MEDEKNMTGKGKLEKWTIPTLKFKFIYYSLMIFIEFMLLLSAFGFFDTDAKFFWWQR